ncbi:hypothetical protein C8J57DRAFT_1319447, partial [Mycena rebaudengoi]
VSPPFVTVNAWKNARDVLSTPSDIQDGQTGVLMVLPPRQTDTLTKRIPDADHPFIAPGPNDQRGPCPAMNTLANHGYISRNGITTFEEIIRGTEEAFNLDRDMASGMAAVNILTRGNPFVNKISIGGVSPVVPPLPHKIDGPETQGIAKHGRVEGDASMTRSDVHIGDNRNFNQTLWNTDLEQLAQFGDDGPDGPATVFNLQTLIELVRQNLESDQLLDPEVYPTLKCCSMALKSLKFAVPIRRLNLVFGELARVKSWCCSHLSTSCTISHYEASIVTNTKKNRTETDFVRSVFANGTTQQATKHIITSFFMNQTFPENWFRAASPVLGSPIPAQIAAALPNWIPGHNDENGVFVADPQAPAPFNISLRCANYWDVQTNAIPGPLAYVTGVFKQNVDLLTGILFNASGCAEPSPPAGPTNI